MATLTRSFLKTPLTPAATLTKVSGTGYNFAESYDAGTFSQSVSDSTGNDVWRNLASIVTAGGNTFIQHLAATRGILTSVTTANPNVATDVIGVLPVANGGTGTATPSLVAGTGIGVTGTWPAQTIAQGQQSIQTKTANYTAAASDLGSLLTFSGGNYTLTLGTQATGWWVDAVVTSSGNNLTVAASSVNGASSVSCSTNQLVRITSLGSGSYVTTPATRAGANDVLTGSATGIYGGVSPGAAQNVLTSNGTAWTAAAPVTSNVVQAALVSNYTCTSAYANAGLSITLTPGTWLLLCTAFAYNAGVAAGLSVRMFDSTAGAAVSGMQGVMIVQSATTVQQSLTIASTYTVTVNTTINLQAQYQIASGPQVVAGSTQLLAVRIG